MNMPECYIIQGGSNMTGTDLCVNKPQSVPVIFEPPCTYMACLILYITRGRCRLFLHSHSELRSLSPLSFVVIAFYLI